MRDRIKRDLRLGGRYLAISAIYIFVWLELHRLGIVLGVYPDASAFYPARGFSLAFAYRFGPRYLPALFVAQCLAASIDSYVKYPIANIAIAAITATGVAFAGLALRRSSFSPQLGRLSDMLQLIAISLVAEIGITLGSVAIKSWRLLWEPSAGFLIGDLTGVLAITPLLLFLSQTKIPEHVGIKA